MVEKGLLMHPSGGSKGANPAIRPNPAMAYTVILRKMSKIGATRCQILTLKCTKCTRPC